MESPIRLMSYAAGRVIQIELTSLVNQACMKPSADRYTKTIPVLCECLKTSNKPWLKALWHRMCDQYCTRDVGTIARQCQTMMKSRASLIYQLVSFDTATGYVGQVAYRELTYERRVEHWRGIITRLQRTCVDKSLSIRARAMGWGWWREY